MKDLFNEEQVFGSEKKDESDPNNNDNIKPEKYSLRPRSLRQKTEKGLELKKEILCQRNKRNSESEKTKPKPPPLSKYRRKTANARERNRMREINVAFETLRRAVPHISGSLHAGNEKLTKITTLRLAMKYIQALRQVLDSSGCSHPSIPSTVSLSTFIDDDADLDILLSDGESLPFNSDMSETFASPDHPLTSPFSELSNRENSPEFCDASDFPFQDSVVVSEFRFDDRLPDSGFCEDFLTDSCIGPLS